MGQHLATWALGVQLRLQKMCLINWNGGSMAVWGSMGIYSQVMHGYKWATGWWFGIYDLFFYISGINHPKWRTQIFFRGVETTHQGKFAELVSSVQMGMEKWDGLGDFFWSRRWTCKGQEENFWRFPQWVPIIHPLKNRIFLYKTIH